MQFFVTIVDPRTHDRADVVIDADERTHIGDLSRVAQALFRDAGDRTGGADGSAVFYVDGKPVDQSLTLAASPVREGSWVSLDDPTGGPPAARHGVVEVRVVGGPDAGAVHRLGVGSGGLGNAADSWVPVTDPAVPTTVATVDVDADACCWVEPVGAGALRIDGEEVRGRTEWRTGEQLTVGSSVLEVAEYTLPDAALQPSAGGLDYNRPPRIRPPRRQTRFRLPAPPKEPERSPLPWLMAVVPLVFAAGLTFITGNRGMLLFALLSPISMVANYLSNRRKGRRSHARLMREYRDRKALIEADAREALAAERVERRGMCPDPATVLVIATGPYHRLWERRRRDEDHLLFRVGSAEIPSEVTVEDPEQEEHRRTVRWKIPEAPVTLPLRERGVIGLAGPDDTARALGRWIVAQAAVMHSPSDLQIVLITDSSGQESWDWVRWLPHSRSTGGAQGPPVLIGTDADSVARRVSWLLELIDQRTSVRTDTGAAGFREPDILVVLDSSRRLRSLPGVVQLLRDGPAVGVFAVCLDTDERLLPAECQAVAVLEPGGLRVAQAGADEITGVRPEHLPPQWCARVARALAPIRDVSNDEDDASLPSSSRLLDVLSLDPPQPQAVVARWNLGGRTTAAVVGESFDGPFEIDLRRDGPHGLIAGTTGSGKSELLQTVVASLAVANRPDAMTFVLVDYKGGSAFGDCVRLPHTVGMVTDLDEHLVRRALESLSAELRRREHVLAAAGAKDIEDYTRGVERQPGGAPLPRLLIVIDEFASMVRDLPDFVTGLVNIAQRGRSLGIHLLLATQRPSGVVSPEIRANTNLRISLRVTDAAESQDVLNAPDAARIAKNTPGRAFVRLGHASLVPFQAARVGGRRAGAARDQVEPPLVVPLRWNDLSQPLDLGRPAKKAVEEDEITDLRVLVEAVREAAAMAGVPPQHSPWLPALPASITLDQLEPAAWHGQGLRPVPYGVDDLPGQQARRTAVVDFATFGHLMAAGAPRTGRSQLLRTIAGSLAATHSCADVHLYGLDCGNGALLPLAALPHCGAVVSRTEVERAVRLIRKLGEEIRRRQGVLANGGYADITEQRAAQPPDRRLAHIVLMLDRWEGFMSSLGELDAGALSDEIFTFLREGASVGVHLLVTGDRSLLIGRISTLTEEKLSFRLADRGDMSLIGLMPRNLPEHIEPGRAFRAESGVETQVALLGPDPSGAAQAAVLADVAAAARERDATVPASLRPFRLGELPTQISFEEAIALRDPALDSGWVLAGVGGDQLTAYGPDLATGVPAFAVGGPAKSGRSTMLATMVRSALGRGQEAVLLAPRTSPLRAMAGVPGVIEVFTTSDVSAEAFTAALGRVKGRALIAIDDAGALRDCDASGELRDVLRTGEQRGLAIVFAGDPEDLSAGFSGWLVDARRSRRGALLSPQNRTDGDLIGIRLQRTAVGQPVQPGRGLLHLGDGEPIVIQVPI